MGGGRLREMVAHGGSTVYRSLPSYGLFTSKKSLLTGLE